MSASRHAVPGAPCWVSLTASDMRAAQDFYGEVLGWTYGPSPLGEEFSAALADGSPVGGIGSLAPGLQTTLVAWIPYFAVEDADAAAARIRERGATVAVGPLPLTSGRGALAADPQGAAFGFWEGKTVPGWSIGQDSAPAGLVLHSRDAFAAAIFYAEVLTWAADEDSLQVEYEHSQVMVRDGARTVAALRGGVGEGAPDPQVRPHWRVHFRVADADAAARAAAAAGGTVVSPPAATWAGREATLRDPDGGLFTVTATTPAPAG